MKYSKSLVIFTSVLLLSSLTPLMAKNLSIQTRQNNIDYSGKIALTRDHSQAKIQIAILLDSSNSMDGLIDQTRTQIWKIVNALTEVTKNGKTPILEVSLYHYGNDSLPSSEGFNRLLSNFTPELDPVSEQLFSIKTNGGQEYAGWVINSAMNQLNWSENPEDFRVIFIAGNEPFNQGNIEWEKSVKLATDKDVIVNTIYCGYAENEESRLWAQGATGGKGSYFNINQDEKIVSIPTPYDAEIAELNQKLNQTYIPYGSQGYIGQQRQAVEDSNAQSNSISGAPLSRAITKSSEYYRNSSWDLIDALTDNIVSLETINNNDLPQNMRSMTLEQKKQYIENKKAERREIQRKIAELSQKRTEYIQKQSINQSSKDTLDYVMIDALRKQLAAKGFILN
jgi:hypothetical protein